MRRFIFCILPFAFCLLLLTACQQRMAEQPGHRGYEASEFFPHGQGVRPLEAGVVYRGERPASDPMVTGLSAEGQKNKTGDPSGKAAWDEKTAVLPPKGAPDKLDNYVTEFPFEITEADLKRGQQRYNIFCAVCHGGDPEAKDEASAHAALFAPLARPDDACGSCHGADTPALARHYANAPPPAPASLVDPCSASSATHPHVVWGNVLLASAALALGVGGIAMVVRNERLRGGAA